jgi:hypothetical protein
VVSTGRDEIKEREKRTWTCWARKCIRGGKDKTRDWRITKMNKEREEKRWATDTERKHRQDKDKRRQRMTCTDVQILQENVYKREENERERAMRKRIGR